MTFDAANNVVYVVGKFSENIYPGGGLPTLQTPTTSAFIFKLSSTTGETLAANGFSDLEFSEGTGVVVSEAGGFLVGSFSVSLHHKKSAIFTRLSCRYGLPTDLLNIEYAHHFRAP